MKKTLLACIIAFATTALTSTAVHAGTIDFANYEVGTRFDAPLIFGDLTFSSTSGVLTINDFGAGKTICAFDGNGCAGTLLIQSSQGISGLTLQYSGDGSPDSSINYEGQTTRLSFVGRLPTDGDPSTAGFLAAGFPGLTLLSLSSNDDGGVGFGNFNFTYDGAVPEPATWLLMIGGFALVGVGLRRRRDMLAA